VISKGFFIYFCHNRQIIVGFVIKLSDSVLETTESLNKSKGAFNTHRNAYSDARCMIGSVMIDGLTRRKSGGDEGLEHSWSRYGERDGQRRQWWRIRIGDGMMGKIGIGRSAGMAWRDLLPPRRTIWSRTQTKVVGEAIAGWVVGEWLGAFPSLLATVAENASALIKPGLWWAFTGEQLKVSSEALGEANGT
jgi:hypothetical protein